MTIGPIRSDQPIIQQAKNVKTDVESEDNPKTEIEVRKKIAALADGIKVNYDCLDLKGLNEKDITDDNSIYNPRDFAREKVAQSEPGNGLKAGTGKDGSKIDKIRQRIEDGYYDQTFVKEKIAEKLSDLLG